MQVYQHEEDAREAYNDPEFAAGCSARSFLRPGLLRAGLDDYCAREIRPLLIFWWLPAQCVYSGRWAWLVWQDSCRRF
jgi:hypothetical protein